MSGYKVLPLVSVALTMAAVVCAGLADNGEWTRTLGWLVTVGLGAVLGQSRLLRRRRLESRTRQGNAGSRATD